MRRTKLIGIIVLGVTTLAGCAEAQEAADTAAGVERTAGKVRDCAALAGSVTELRLGDAANADRLREGADRLRRRAEQIDTQDVRDAASALADRAQEYATALAAGRATDIQRADQRMDAAIRDTAGRCGISPEQFAG